MLGPLVAAIDQGTSSTRFLVFNSKTAELLSHHQVEINQSFPKEGWVEEDPKEILQSVFECMDRTCEKLTQLNIDISNIKAIGVTNQRETTLVWDKDTGEPLYNAIGKVHTSAIKHKTGLPISTYFSAVKLRWLMDNVDEVHQAVISKRAMFGTIDSWIIWCLTGGKSGGVHCTDVTNASRTMLFNIHTLDWDPELCKYFDIPMEILPKVRSSSEIYGLMKSGALTGIPISGCLGDQSAALVGQMCFQDGQAKNTYGTGCFLLRNTGAKPVMSDHGLLTTVAYKLGRDKPACYALEGSVAIAGAVVRWLRDNLGIIQTSEELEKLAASVGTSYGCYFVPAFSGLYAPYWEPSARGIICGLTQFTNRSHVAFAALEAVCFQTREILDAMNQDSGIPLNQLQVDGGMTSNRLLMQLQADILCIPVVKPSMPETTALGAAMAAGAAEGVSVWSLRSEDLSEVTSEKFEPQINPEESEFRYARWKKAVEKSMNWETTEPDSNGNGETSIFSSVPLGFYIIGSMMMLVGAKYIADIYMSVVCTAGTAMLGQRLRRHHHHHHAGPTGTRITVRELIQLHRRQAGSQAGCNRKRTFPQDQNTPPNILECKQRRPVNPAHEIAANDEPSSPAATRNVSPCLSVSCISQPYVQGSPPQRVLDLPAVPENGNMSLFQWQVFQESRKWGDVTAEMLDMQDEDGDTYLHIAVAQGKRALAYVLAEKSSGFIDTKEHNGQSALQIAVLTDQHLIVQDLLLLGAKVNTNDHWGRSPLHVCAEKGHVLTLQTIHKTLGKMQPIDIDLFNYEGLTPLHVAVISYNCLVRELRELSTVPTLIAMELTRRKQQYIDCVKTLLVMGAQCGRKDLKNGKTSLHFASEEANEELFHIILNHPSSSSIVNEMTYSGNTALHIVCSLACDHGILEAVMALLRNGADSSAKNLENDQPVHLVPGGPIGVMVQ
ncbi:unnamed protein product [Merluccius merluccius]